MTEQDRELQKLRAENKRLTEELQQTKRQIDAYVREFRVCRFCSEVHSDCSPTDSSSCYPRWRGL